MATSTPNYGLKKFENGDPPDLPSLAASMDKIDTEIKKNENAAAANATNIGLLAGAVKYLGDVSYQNANNLPTGYGMVNSETAANYGYPVYYGVILVLNTGAYRAQCLFTVAGPSTLRTRSSNDGGATWTDWATK